MAIVSKQKSIRTEIVTILFLSTFLIALVLGYLSFEFSKRRLSTMLGEVLKGIATTTTHFVKAEDMSFILSNAERIKNLNFGYGSAAFSRIYETEGRDEVLDQAIATYRKYVEILSDIKEVNKIDSPINVYVRYEDTLRLVLTSDKVMLTGAQYVMGPGVKKAFATRLPQATGIYTDKDGAWISAYAPIIPKRKGDLPAVIEINYKIDAYMGKLREELATILLVCIIGFIIIAFVSYRPVNKLVSAIEKLDDVAGKLEREKYDVRIDVRSKNEIGHLAQTFEKLRVSIKKKIEELRLALVREKKAHLESIVAITNAIEMRDSYTAEHLRRVENYAKLIARAMHLPHKKMDTLRYSCYLHDIGKIGVSDTILKKHELSESEWEQVKRHSEIGALIVEDIEFLTEVKEVILHHQECFDGSGYPDGLKGEQIPLLARIVAVADAFDAMTTKRPYKEKMTYRQAMDEIQKQSGKQFDPAVCTALLSYRDSIEEIAEKHFRT